MAILIHNVTKSLDVSQICPMCILGFFFCIRPCSAVFTSSKTSTVQLFQKPLGMAIKILYQQSPAHKTEKKKVYSIGRLFWSLSGELYFVLICFQHASTTGMLAPLVNWFIMRMTLLSVSLNSELKISWTFSFIIVSFRYGFNLNLSICV